MCINPLILRDGTKTACRQCWQCRENRINDWVGRCIAESETAFASHSVTLTYGADGGGKPDHVRAAVLTYSDVQKYIMRLRRGRDGLSYPCRYFAVGEYGSTKGRAHWHVVLFWQSPDIPPHELAERFWEPHWPHGLSFWDRPSPAAIRYVCKYLLKDQRDGNRQGYVAMSKKPPLGSEYFRRLARRYVDQGLSPQEPYYWFPDVLDPDGRPVKFHLAGRSLDLFCASFIAQWSLRSRDHWPRSELIEAFLDREANLVESVQLEPFKPGYAVPWIEPPQRGPIHFSESHNAHYCVVDGLRFFWSFDLDGERAWQSEIRTEAQAEILRAESARRREPGKYSEIKTGTVGTPLSRAKNGGSHNF